MDDLLVASTVVTALGCGLSAGALFAFSSFVMKALERLPPAQGVAAMQSINVMAVTPAFMSALFGTAVLCIVVAVWAVADWTDSYSPYLLAGGALYVAGVPGVTMVFNVPRNNALARLDPDSPDASEYWRRYLVEWTAWNHVRAATGIAAVAAYAIALHVG